MLFYKVHLQHSLGGLLKVEPAPHHMAGQQERNSRACPDARRSRHPHL